MCLVIPLADKERFEDALSDVLCWLNGFKAGGGEYSPETQLVLRDLRDKIRLAYDTLPPLDDPLVHTKPPGKKGGGK